MVEFHKSGQQKPLSGALAGLRKFLYGYCMQYREELFQAALNRSAAGSDEERSENSK
jgi:hypothetical protein